MQVGRCGATARETRNPLGKPVYGPDLLDVKTMANALEALHAVKISIELIPSPVTYAGDWQIIVWAVSTSATPMVAPKTYRLSQWQTAARMADLDAVLYGLLYKLEPLLQAGQWVQMELPQ